MLVMGPPSAPMSIVDFSLFAGRTLMLMNHKPRRPISNPAPQLPEVMRIPSGKNDR